jgi:hypothetical protein
MNANYNYSQPAGAFTATRPQVPTQTGVSAASSLRRRPARYELTDEQKAEIREAFEIFDMDKDGALDFHEFKVHCLHSWCDPILILFVGGPARTRL